MTMPITEIILNSQKVEWIIRDELAERGYDNIDGFVEELRKYGFIKPIIIGLYAPIVMREDSQCTPKQ